MHPSFEAWREGRGGNRYIKGALLPPLYTHQRFEHKLLGTRVEYVFFMADFFFVSCRKKLKVGLGRLCPFWHCRKRFSRNLTFSPLPSPNPPYTRTLSEAELLYASLFCNGDVDVARTALTFKASSSLRGNRRFDFGYRLGAASILLVSLRRGRC